MYAKISAVVSFMLMLFFSENIFSQTARKELAIKRMEFKSLNIDGQLDEAVWKTAPLADKFVELRPVPFKQESVENATEIYFLYNNDGIYIGGYLHERKKDSIAAELTGRDGFGNNDFVGIVIDTYLDKLNGFEYFVTPLGEQMDAKVSPGNGEDFSWNAVWESASKLQENGWSFEMFIPYSAIRFGKKKVQDWGLNIVRRRQKSGEQLFWQSIDPNVNGFLTQEGKLTGLEDIKPPVRLQLTPYFSAYLNNDGLAPVGEKKTTFTMNGGMDVKYGLNQAFTLDMTLIPDFGQTISDNRILNLGPFEQRFDENRTFFTEGTELFSKGNLFYSRRIGNIGGRPSYYYDVENQLGADEFIDENPGQIKLINATKVSGRTQKGLGIGILNAITNTQKATIKNSVTGETRKFETEPLTNYNVLVLDQTLKNNSSISLVNTNVLRNGNDYDANVSSVLFDFNDKKNTWNIGGNVGMSAQLGIGGEDIFGYTHNLYFGKTSGRFNFNVWQDYVDAKYDKSDLGYFTNNNTMDQGFWMGYNWNKPKGWYNSLSVSANGWYSRLVKPIDAVKGSDRMYQGSSISTNLNAQTRKFWNVGLNVFYRFKRNDFYEPRRYGRVFVDNGRVGAYTWWNSNSSKKYSWGGNFFIGTGSLYRRTAVDLGLFGKVRFNSKFSVELSVQSENAHNDVGYAFSSGNDIIFSRRDVISVYSNLFVKYSFTNRMGLTLNARHNWTKVAPSQFYLLNLDGNLDETTYTKNVDQNYNYLALDMVYTWQFAQGSFLNFVWKNIGEDFRYGNEAINIIDKGYIKNLGNTVSGNALNSSDFNSVSLRIIYFIDYLTVKNKFKKPTL